jgi:ribosome biogenesis protein Nip4
MKEFIKQFADRNIIDLSQVIQLRSDFFLVPGRLKEILSRTKHIPSFIGISLGKKKKNFVPSTYLLSKVAEATENKVVVNKQGAWLFICGRHIYARSLVSFSKSQKINDFVLVMNEYGECLGYGKVINPLDSKKVAVQNLFDIGDFVRRERRK